jgi:hypothetical protein
MYMSTHPDAARRIDIYCSADTQTIANSPLRSSLALRREAQAADTHEEQLAIRQSVHDAAYEMIWLSCRIVAMMWPNTVFDKRSKLIMGASNRY